MLKTQIVENKVAQIWLEWLFLSQKKSLQTEADLTFIDELESQPAFTPLSGSSYYIVSEDDADKRIKDLLLIRTKKNETSMELRFCRIFHVADDTDHYRDAHLWIRCALKDGLLDECVSKDCNSLFCRSCSKEQEVILERIKEDIANVGPIINKDGYGVIAGKVGSNRIRMEVK